MSSPLFLNWKRFWCPRDGSYRLTDAGYLLDYEDAPSYLADPNIVTLENLFDVRCLIMLGEPGIGKSTEIEKHSKFIKEKIESTGDEFLKFDLKDYQSDYLLFNDIFDNPVFKTWYEGEHRLYLFLDSLDEALLNINILSTALPARIKNLPVERLYFRIASRIADWPINLEQELGSIWEEQGEQNTLVYELLPLRKQDVKEYAKANGIDSDVFIKKIEDRDGQPFAIKPVTLTFLAKIYKRDGDIPKTKKEMYIKGSLHLCTEENRSRITSRRSGRLTPEQKMKIAGRIAALSLFSNKSTIWIGLYKDDCQESDLAKQSIYGGQESLNGIDFIVGPEEVNETLNTGLFSARGQERLGWSHRTYVEFLAAWYLIEHDFEESKILSLISHSGDMHQRLTPQLQETAAWLATFSSQIFDILKDRNPEVLLRSDVLSADSSVRASLVQALLTMYASGKLFELSWRDIFQYKKLTHPDLANQLRTFMCDKTKNFRTRRLAIDIAEECVCLDLLDELVGIALDREELLAIREQAAHAVMQIGDKTIKSKLKTLITNSGGDDVNDELRACGFMANWPDNMSANELFGLISPPKQDSIIGSYSEFLNGTMIVQHLKLQDIPTALNWVAKSCEYHRMPGDPLNDLMNQIMLLGWNNLNQPGVLVPFSLAALVRINNFYGILSRDISWRMGENFQPQKIIEEDDVKRHLLVIEILNLSSRVSFDPIHLIFGQTPLIFKKDFDWLITTYASMKDVSQKDAIAKWLSRICDLTDLEQMSTLYDLYEKDTIFKEIFKGWFDAVELGTDRAIKQKEWFLASQNKNESSPKVDPPLAERIKIQLEKIEQGEISSWWILNRELTIDETLAQYGNQYEQDITELPGWKSSDNGIKERILSAAKRYIDGGNPNNKEWMGKNIIYWPALAGYRALRLILKESHQDILRFDAHIWQKWAAIICTYPMTNSEKANYLDDTLLKVANIFAPDEVKETLIISIKKENRKDGWINLNRFNCIWDENLEVVLMQSLKFKNLKPNLFRTILGFLLQHRSQAAQDYVIRKVKSYQKEHKANERENIATATQLLWVYNDDPKWDVIWGILKEDLELADDVIGGVAYHHESQKIFSLLSFDQLAELYLFLIMHYPPEDDPNHENESGYTVTVRDQIGRWRDSIINFMANSGYLEACKALQRLSFELPQYEHLQYALFRAEFNMRQKTWIPLNESELLDLFLKPDAIIVESEQHLLDAIIQSLKHLDQLFQGETPQAIYLWNEMGNNIYRPKDENRLSDYVKIHLGKELKQKGIIVNREVEIRRGEETDIHVDAIKKTANSDLYDTVTVIIEVKGCWHRKLENAMATQLKDRYLKNNRCRAGIYLIGWFNCDKWDQKDYRCKDAPKYSLSEAILHFESQATNLCTEDLILKSYVLNLSI